MQAKYYIYRNLRTGGFSVKFRGIVIDHSDSLIATNVEFRVSEPGRQRVITERRKNVHAYAAAESYRKVQKVKVDKLPKITYNPYLDKQFKIGSQEINTANKVVFKEGRCYIKE